MIIKERSQQRNVLTTGFLFIILLLLCRQDHLAAQNYLSAGWHLGMPMKIDNCCNALIQVKPVPVSSFSVTFKHIWKNKHRRKWFYEFGLTSAGLGYQKTEHENDTLGTNPWGIFRDVHHGFPSALLGLGRNLPLKNKHEFVLGLEVSGRLSHSLESIVSNDFSLHYAEEDVTFPIFLRANLGYSIPLRLFGQVPAHLLFYTKLSAQNIAKGPQYLRDPTTGVINREGKYRVNNSEAGVQFYLDLGKQYYGVLDRPEKERKPKEKRTGKPRFRISLEQQLYSPRPTQYYFPQVDSFSLTGMKVSMAGQIGIKAEFFHFRNPNWSTVVKTGIGKIVTSYDFTALAEFTPAGTPIVSFPSWSPIGWYGIQNLGLGYQHKAGNKKILHTLSVSLVEPLEDYAFGFAVGDAKMNYVLKADFLERYPHHKLIAGVEYSPELMLNLDRYVFFGLGMVFNYSWGVIAQGRGTVSNGVTTYYGGMLQRFGKIGFSARIGFQTRESVFTNRLE